MRFVLSCVFIVTMLVAGCSKTTPEGATLITVYKSPNCQCCSGWVKHLRQHGFAVRIKAERDLASIRAKLGVPEQLAACHTAVVDGYLIEGHVPASDIRRLISERPKANGIAVPGMPIGSPGMEVGERHDPYEVLLFDTSGETQAFTSHGNKLAVTTAESGAY
ncbi:MAG: DUF411 domain-containing protein [Pseudomonadota bacterium]|nr:DUF411 domain-containing protein [Pseudomonadota bacterium]